MKATKVRKKPNMRRLVLAAALAISLAVSPAFAAAPKADSTVTRDQITLGDVFDGIRDNADYYLAPAPEMGKTVTLNAGDLLRISEAFNLGWTPGNGPRQVVIHRSANEIGRHEIEDALQKKLTETLKGQKLEAELFDSAASLQVPDPADKTLNVGNLSYNAARNEFRAEISTAGAPELKKEVTGKVYFIHQVPVLREPLHQGDVISSGDIDYIDVRAADIAASVILEADKLVGQTPRRGLAAMKPVMAGDVRLPVLIKKGDLVTMLLKSDLINLTAQGRALDNGAAGDAIHVMNTTSKQVIDAVVAGPQTVNIRPPMNIF
ncbi:MAG: flagellar basal body P-ring formation chaperone FlgA [Alphaproteobacteria bacterium]|nr:flagellar basal body P-ring formation chaperone FlgA [Alphaproteobacteria bacterium]